MRKWKIALIIAGVIIVAVSVFWSLRSVGAPQKIVIYEGPAVSAPSLMYRNDEVAAVIEGKQAEALYTQMLGLKERTGFYSRCSGPNTEMKKFWNLFAKNSRLIREKDPSKGLFLVFCKWYNIAK